MSLPVLDYLAAQHQACCAVYDPIREPCDCGAVRTPLVSAEAAQRSEQVLRRLLAYRCAGAKLYADDGELQDNSAHPFIDYRRDSVDVIEQKLGARTLAAFNALSPAEVAHALAGGAQPDWQECQRISDLPDVDETLRGFLEDPTGDNATCVVRAILNVPRSNS